MGLEVVRRTDTGVLFRWSTVDSAKFHRYVLLRATAPAKPTWPRTAATVIVAQSTSASSVEGADRQPPAGQQRYRVVALDNEDRVLASSPVITIEI